MYDKTDGGKHSTKYHSLVYRASKVYDINFGKYIVFFITRRIAWVVALFVKACILVFTKYNYTRHFQILPTFLSTTLLSSSTSFSIVISCATASISIDFLVLL